MKKCTMAGLKYCRGRGMSTDNPAWTEGMKERLLRQDLNPIRLMALFALPLRGSEVKQVTNGEFYGR